MVARVWLQPFVDAQNGRRETLCVVYLEHNNLSGAVSLQIRAPGSEVVVDGGVSRVVVGKSATIPFSVAACVGRVSILPKATGFDYLLNWAGNGVAEMQQRTIESLEPLMPRDVTVEVGPSVECHSGKSFYKLVVSANGETREPASCIRDDFREILTGTTINIVTDACGRRELTKRFSEFQDCYERVKDAYAGSHLRSNVPAPPKKCLNPFQNQLDPDFVENRRVELNDFAKKMVVLPRVLVNPALLDFLGLALQPI